MTKKLFEKYPTAFDLASATQSQVERIVKSAGFFRSKAKNIRGCASQLVEKYDVYTITIDTGGFLESEKQKIKKQSISMGAKKHISINSKEKYYKRIVKYLIYGNVLKNNTYQLSVSAERIIHALEILKYAEKKDIKLIAHGCTGAGNDQVRFDSIFESLAPNIKIIAPIRDKNISRKYRAKFGRYWKSLYNCRTKA